MKFLKPIVVMAVMTALLFFGPAAYAESVARPHAFLSAIQDVPLPHGATELTDETAAFDKPEGRIVESMAEIGVLSPGAVSDFYKETLPQMGWRPAGVNRYARDSEQLAIDFETLEGRHYVRFALSPLK